MVAADWVISDVLMLLFDSNVENFASVNRWASGLPTLICRVRVYFDNRYRGPPNWVSLLPTISASARPNLGFDSVGDEDEMGNLGLLLRLLPLKMGICPDRIWACSAGAGDR
ncbi:hypothetical protein ACLOJK_040565 [Asimina triloba]